MSTKATSTVNDASDWVQEVMRAPPRWIFRYGMLIVFFFLLSLLFCAWWIRYPDRIPADIIITNLNPPVPVVAQTSGNISQWFVQDRQIVKEAQPLVVISNTANYQDIQQLEQQLPTWDAASLYQQNADSISIPSLAVGELQPLYAQVAEALQQYKAYHTIYPQQAEQRDIRQQRQELYRLLKEKQEHLALAERKQSLLKKDYERTKRLHASKTVADKQLEDNERTWLASQEEQELIESELAQIRVQLSAVEREYNLLGVQADQQISLYESNLQIALDQLRAGIAQWKKQYVLTAPVAGVVSLSHYWSDNQYITQQQEVMYIVPEDTQTVVGKMQMPIYKAGKVVQGQAVHVYLANFPAEEYGHLVGEVSSVSLLPQGDFYTVEVYFPQGLTTVYGQQLPSTLEMQGRGEIITEDLRLIERLFYTLRKKMIDANK